MNSKLLAIFIILLLVFSAGCTVKVGPQKAAEDNVSTEAAAPVEAEKEVVEAEKEEDTTEPVETVNCGPYWLEYQEHLKSGFSHIAAVKLTHECVEAYAPTGQETSATPKTSAKAVDAEADVLSYLQENPIAQFGDLADRIRRVTITGTVANLTYSTTTTDPSQESAYLSGVLLAQFPDVATVVVTGYNHEDKVMEASLKRFTRKKYNFNNYKLWFPDYEYNECTEDSECNDNNDCTRDFCKDKKCYNSKLVSSVCLP